MTHQFNFRKKTPNYRPLFIIGAVIVGVILFLFIGKKESIDEPVTKNSKIPKVEKKLETKGFMREIFQLEDVLYNRDITRLEDVEEVWSRFHSLKNEIAVLGRQNPEKAEMVNEVVNRMELYGDQIVDALVAWRDTSSLFHMRQGWEQLRGSIFKTHKGFQRADAELDTIQKKRHPENDSDIMVMLDEFQNFAHQSKSSFEQIQQDYQDGQTNKDSDPTEDQYGGLGFSAWADQWGSQEEELIANKRERPVWVDYGHGDKRINKMSGYLHKYRLDRKSVTQWHSDGAPDQGPTEFEKTLECIDKIRGDFEAIARNLNWGSSIAADVISKCEDILEEIEKARSYMKVLGY